MNLTINQALNFWAQLFTAWNGENIYARDTAEIYLKTMMEHCYQADFQPDSVTAKQAFQVALDNIFCLLKKFRDTFGGEITVNNVLLDNASEDIQNYGHIIWITVKRLD